MIYSLFVADLAWCPSHVIERIRQVYQNCEGVILPIPWCDDFNFQIQDILTRLKVVAKEKTPGIETTKEITNMTSIFTPHKCCKHPLIVLIVGEPGMGKTTYCQKLVFDWASKQCGEWDESFPRIDVILLLRCRGIKSTIWDAVEEQILRDEIEPEEKDKFFQFLKENPSKVLLVLDGLDEADPQKLDVYWKLIQGKELPGCYIVLTCCHEAGSKVRPYADTLLEIVGFTTTDAEGYIRKYFQHAEHLAKALISNVKFDMDLRELTKNPLNTLLLCVISEDLKGILPTNRTKLYVEIVLFVLRRYESKNGLSNRGEDLLLVYKKELMMLGKTALHSLREGELYFDDHKGDVKESLLLKLGFLSIQSGGSRRAPCDRYGFSHKSFQEFFSGYFLAYAVMDGVKNSYSVLTNQRYMGELVRVLKFMSGIIALQSKKTAESIVHSIASIVNETGGTSYKFVSNLTFAHELIKECKACSRDFSSNLDRTFGKRLKLVDVVARPSTFPWDSKCIETFFKALSFNSTVSNLSLSGIKFIDLLADALKVNSSVSSLDLTDNSISDEGANSLARALRKNTSLSSLDLSDNSIADQGACLLGWALRVNHSLSSMDLSRNSIGDEGADLLAWALRVNASLSSLVLSFNSIGAKGANSLAQALEVNTSLSFLNLYSNFIGALGANSLAHALRVNNSLSSLDLSSNSIGDEGADLLAKALRVNTSLSSLVLSFNSIGAEGANSLAWALRVKSSSLSSLDLTGNTIVDEGAYSLARALRKHTSLSSLNLDTNSIAAEGAKSLAEALRENTSLSSLDLSYNLICDEGANSLAQALGVNTSLSSLHLSCIGIGDEGAISLVVALGKNTSLSRLDLSKNSVGYNGIHALRYGLLYGSLSSLDLSKNSLGDRGAVSLAWGLRENTSLSSLKLFYNSIGDVGARSLARALRENISLSSLDLHGNTIGAEGATSFAGALGLNTSLSSLDLRFNFIGANGANSFAETLRVNTSLSSLDLSCNFISDEGAISLAQALRVNASLSSLGLSYNAIGDEGAHSLAQALRVNKSLSSLDLSDNSIGPEGANLLAESLSVNTSLSSFSLRYNSFGDE